MCQWVNIRLFKSLVLSFHLLELNKHNFFGHSIWRPHMAIDYIIMSIEILKTGEKVQKLDHKLSQGLNKWVYIKMFGQQAKFRRWLWYLAMKLLQEITFSQDHTPKLKIM